jgi:hypothetical protein
VEEGGVGAATNSILSDPSNKLILKSDFFPCTLVTNSGNLIPVTETLRTKDTNYEIHR